jgi:hypothetical protein
MLPLTALPPEWTVGKSAKRHLETFNAENLYEKIDGRAESFIQYGVRGMAYAYYHPTSDVSKELQLYIFEMADPLKALGKYGSEKPDEFTPVALGSEGYASAGSVLFYSGRYYTQIVSSQDDSTFGSFALELARRVVSHQKTNDGSARPSENAHSTTPVVTNGKMAQSAPGGLGASSSPVAGIAHNTGSTRDRTKPKLSATEVSPATYFALLPTHGRQGDPKYVAQDVFGYSFFSDVFMADYKIGDASWQGFIRPYRTAQEAKAILDKYIEGVKKDGAEVKRLSAEGADEMVISANIGLTDVVFRRGNTLAGANGATSASPAEAFARNLAKSLPADVPSLHGTR